MSGTQRERRTCRLCGGSRLAHVLRLPATPIGDEFLPSSRLQEQQQTYPLELVRCTACSHVQLRHVVDPDALYRDYAYTTSVSLGLPEHFRQAAGALRQRIAPPLASLVVEIGSNEGAMLRAFREAGLRVLGVDPARAIAEQASTAGIETWPMYFSAAVGARIRAERGPASLIVANNVIANVDDLGDLVDGVRSALAPDGAFVFETSYWADVVRHNLLDTVFHEHLSYLAAAPLAGFFRRHGLELVDVERIPTKGGSLRGIVRPSAGAPAPSPAVRGLIAEESALGLDGDEAGRGLDARLARLREGLLGLVRPLKVQGRTLVGYGASVGITTMIYWAELGGLLDYLVDDNPRKIGLFSPGLHLPVHASSVLEEWQPDYVLALAWRYLEPIQQRHAEYLARGGRLVRVLPAIELVDTVHVAEPAPS